MLYLEVTCAACGESFSSPTYKGDPVEEFCPECDGKFTEALCAMMKEKEETGY